VFSFVGYNTTPQLTVGSNEQLVTTASTYADGISGAMKLR
jgi:hypothetical protein